MQINNKIEINKNISVFILGISLLLGLYISLFIYKIDTIKIVFFDIILYGSLSFITYKIYKKKNWARILFTILVLSGIVFGFNYYFSLFKKLRLDNILYLVQTILQVISLTLLYTKKSNICFKRIKDDNNQ